MSRAGCLLVMRLIESVDAAEDFGEDPWDGQGVLAMRIPITSAIDRGAARAANDGCEGAMNSGLSGRGRRRMLPVAIDPCRSSCGVRVSF
jgi:hypothetical protein